MAKKAVKAKAKTKAKPMWLAPNFSCGTQILGPCFVVDNNGTMWWIDPHGGQMTRVIVE